MTLTTTLCLLLYFGIAFNSLQLDFIQRETRLKIKPGSAVGNLSIGDSREKIISVLGKKKGDEEYSYAAPCEYAEFHWLDLETHSNGLFIYLKEGRIFQIEVATPRYSTEDGITIEVSIDAIKRKCVKCDIYRLVHSGSKVVGGQDLMYWVDVRNGIAFELYYNQKNRRQQVSKIIIFKPRTEFLPEGCVAFPKKLRKLS